MRNHSGYYKLAISSGVNKLATMNKFARNQQFNDKVGGGISSNLWLLCVVWLFNSLEVVLS